MDNIHLFCGENIYNLNQELKRWLNCFKEKHGPDNLVKLEAKNISRTEFFDCISSMPFLAEKRLIFISGIPAFEKENCQSLPKIIHPDVVLLFVETKPDKRLSFVKELFKIAQVKEFPVYTENNVLSWIKQNYQINREAVLLLIRTVGLDQLTLAQELDKLSIYSGNDQISSEAVEFLSVPPRDKLNFQLIDKLTCFGPDEVFNYTKTLLDRGESPQTIWAMLLWIISSFVQVWFCVQDGIISAYKIVQSTGLKLPTVVSLLPLARNINRNQLKYLLTLTLNGDKDLKTGRLRATNEAPEEIMVLIDKCTLQFQNR